MSIAHDIDPRGIDPRAAAPREFDPRDFGAAADGHTLDTAALQRALDAAAAVHGRVRLAGGVFRSGSLFMRSGSELHVDAGATLLGSTDIAHYPRIDTRVSGIEMRWPAALVNAIDVHSVALRGQGTIDGDGAGFWAAYWQLRAEMEPRGLRWAADYDAERPRLVLLQGARNAFVGGGLTLRRSGFWTLHLCYSEQVRVDGLVIRNNDDGRGPSTDGIDIDSCTRVWVRHADIDVNDDAIAFKAGRDADGLRVARATHNVLVSDCTVRGGATGVAFGSETSGGFERVRVRRLKVQAPVPVGVLIKSARTRGGFARDLRFSNITLDGVGTVLRITLDWNPAFSRALLPPELRASAPPHWLVLAAPVPPEQGLVRVQGVRWRGLHVRGAGTAFEVDADAASPLEDFYFEQLDIQAQRGGHLLDVRRWRFDATQLRLQQPLVLHDAAAVQGLPPQVLHIDPTHPRRDVSTLAMHEQDVN